jgi:hypothetical protein
MKVKHELVLDLSEKEYDLMDKLSHLWKLQASEIIRIWIHDHAPQQIKNPNIVDQGLNELLERGLLTLAPYGPCEICGKIEAHYRPIKPGDYGLSECDVQDMVGKIGIDYSDLEDTKH